MPADHHLYTRSKRGKSIVAPSRYAATRVGNGKSLFIDEVDERSMVARRFRELLAQVATDLGGDLTAAQQAIARRACALAVWCESCEPEMDKGNELDIGQFTTAANSLRRLLADLGLERRAKDVTPSLADITRQIHADRGEAA